MASLYRPPVHNVCSENWYTAVRSQRLTKQWGLGSHSALARACVRRTCLKKARGERKRMRWTYVILSWDATFPLHEVNCTVLLLGARIEAHGMVKTPLLALLHEAIPRNSAHCSQAKLSFRPSFSPKKINETRTHSLGGGCRVQRKKLPHGDNKLDTRPFHSRKRFRSTRSDTETQRHSDVGSDGKKSGCR